MLSAADKAQLAEALGGFALDPLGYVLFAFPWGQPGTELADETGPRDWQRQVLEEVGERLRGGVPLGEAIDEGLRRSKLEPIQDATASGHGIGKSALVAWLIRWALSTHEDTRGVVTANTDTQLRTKTWPEVEKWHRLALDRELFVCSATALYSVDPGHEKTWRIDAIPWSEHNTEAFAGLHNLGKRIVVVFDEASAIADKIWEVTEGALTDEATEILWFAFGNPTVSTGRFRECFRKNRHRWRTRQIDSRTVEGTNKAQLQKWVDDHGEDSDFVKIRVRGMFPSLSERQYISEKDADAGLSRKLGSHQYEHAPKILTLDNAWTGTDEGCIGLRQGLMFRVLRTFAKNDNDVWVANELARLEDEHEADAVFMDAGYGTGVYSVGITMGRTWELVWFGGEANDPGCVNKRAEMWQGAREWLKAGGAYEDQQLHDELLGPETVPRPDGKLLIESKDSMKKRGLPSPNRADSLALSFFRPVQKRRRYPGQEQGYAVGHDYNPFDGRA